MKKRVSLLPGHLKSRCCFMWRGVLLLVSRQFAAAMVGKRWNGRGVVIYSWERAVEPAGLFKRASFLPPLSDLT